MTTPLKAELKDGLRQLRLPEFAAQRSQQSAVAITENRTYDQYPLKLCQLELQLRDVRSVILELNLPSYRMEAAKKKKAALAADSLQ
jgi:hypothetical protein